MSISKINKQGYGFSLKGTWKCAKG